MEPISFLSDHDKVVSRIGIAVKKGFTISFPSESKTFASVIKRRVEAGPEINDCHSGVEFCRTRCRIASRKLRSRPPRRPTALRNKCLHMESHCKTMKASDKISATISIGGDKKTKVVSLDSKNTIFTGQNSRRLCTGGPLALNGVPTPYLKT